MAIKLEKITGETCIYRYHALRSTVVPEVMEKCRNNCINNYKDTCEFYKPLKDFHVRIKGMKEYYGNANTISKKD